jgi:transcription antitermination factor NusG
MSHPTRKAVFSTNGFFGFIGVGLKPFLISQAQFEAVKPHQRIEKRNKRNKPKPSWRYDFLIGKGLQLS